MKRIQPLALSMLIVLIITGCSNAPSHQSKWKNPLIESLSNIRGEYLLSKESRAYDYSQKVTLDSIIRMYDQNTILDSLVNYIDDSDSSKSVFEGKPVLVGILCYEALSLLIYFEPVDENGDIAQNWPGALRPGSTEAELKTAKEAWKKVLQSKNYKFL